MRGQTQRGRAVLRGIARAEPRVLAVLFAIYASVAVAWMALLVPPFCNADETAHFLRADQVASGVLVASRPGGMVEPGIGEVAARFDPVRSHAGVRVGRAMLKAAWSVRWGQAAAVGFPSTAIYPPTGYLPAAAAILAGRHGGWTIAETLTAARLFNGAVCIAACAAAIALSGGMAVLLFTLLCLPMSLALLATVSQDGVLISAAAMALAALVQVQQRADARWAGLLCLGLGVAAMGRPPYLPMTAVLLTMGRVRWPLRLACVACVTGAVLVWSLWCAGPILAETIRPQGVDPGQQAAWLLGHPALLYQVPVVMLSHQWASGLPYVRQFVGVLGSLDVSLPGEYTILACGTIGLAVMLARPGPLTAQERSLAAAAIILSCAAIFAIQYLTWTTIGSHLVEGVQGRYFLPLAMFVPLALRSVSVGDGTRWRHAACVFLATFPALSIAVAARALTHRYYS